MRSARHRAKFLAGLCLAIAITTQAFGVAIKVHDGRVDGRVFDSTTNLGVPGMTIKLKPPTSSHKPEKITLTRDDGSFQFPTMEKGRYLFEVYQGVNLVYRRVVDTTVDEELRATLKRQVRSDSPGRVVDPR